MRIGILTLPLHTNYGGILQAYALQTILMSLGHNVIVFTKEREFHVPHGISGFITYVKRCFEKYIFHRDGVYVRPEAEARRLYKRHSHRTNSFIKERIHTCFIPSLDKVKNQELKLDAIVVGSDQIWRPKYIKETLQETVCNAFLAFTEDWDIKRVAYAASFGTNTWEYTDDETVCIKKLASQFDNVSTREASGVKLCEENLGISACHLLDPTMLLDATHYLELLEGQEFSHAGDIFCYILDKNNDKDLAVQDISRKINGKAFYTQSFRVQDIHPSVECWIHSFYHARFIVTDSFHACVFSILFHKPFIILANESRGTDRLESLLSMFGLENRIIRPNQEIPETLLMTNIDYIKIQEIINQKRKDSLSFLSNNL